MGPRETIFSKLWGGSKAYFQEQNCCFREGIAWAQNFPQTLWKWHLMVLFSLVQKGWVNHLKVARFEPRLLWKGWVPWIHKRCRLILLVTMVIFFSCGHSSLGYTLYTKLLFCFLLILLNPSEIPQDVWMEIPPAKMCPNQSLYPTELIQKNPSHGPPVIG